MIGRSYDRTAVVGLDPELKKNSPSIFSHDMFAHFHKTRFRFMRPQVAHETLKSKQPHEQARHLLIGPKTLRHEIHAPATT
jgi:hypothetical protein